MIGALVGQLLGSLVTTNLASAGAAKLRRSGQRVAWFIAAALAIGVLGAAACGCFGAAIWYALLPRLGPAGAAAITGVAFAIVAGIIWAACRHWYLEPRMKAAETPSPLSDLKPTLPSAAALGQMLERNAGTAMLVAFAIGLLAGRRK
jgi:hypothetical protein